MQKGGTISSIDEFPMSYRITNAFASYIIYIGKMLWPSNLAVFYPHLGLWPVWQILGAVLILIAVTLTIIWRAERLPYLAMGWLWYVGTLVPVIGIIQVGEQAMADRYTYIPLIGLFIMAAWGIPGLLKNWRYQKEVLFALPTLCLLCLLIVTRTQVGHWQNSITLFDHTLKVTENNYFVYNNRYAVYVDLGNYKQAISDYDRALEINPNYAEAYCNQGLTYVVLGNYKQAISDYDRAIEINPNYAEAYYNRGIPYIRLGNQKQAIEDLKTAARLGLEHSKNILRSYGIN